ncbi:MAG: hypothetical protein QM817_30960 [Archangium sp.]
MRARLGERHLQRLEHADDLMKPAVLLSHLLAAFDDLPRIERVLHLHEVRERFRRGASGRLLHEADEPHRLQFRERAGEANRSFGGVGHDEDDGAHAAVTTTVRA